MDGGLQMADVCFMERNDFSCRRYSSSLQTRRWLTVYAYDFYYEEDMHSNEWG